MTLTRLCEMLLEVRGMHLRSGRAPENSGLVALAYIKGEWECGRSMSKAPEDAVRSELTTLLNEPLEDLKWYRKGLVEAEKRVESIAAMRKALGLP